MGTLPGWLHIGIFGGQPAIISMAHRAKQLPPEPGVRRNRIAPVGPDAGQIGRVAFDRAGFQDHTLVLRWEEIVGQDVARLAQPLKLSEGPAGGVLTLLADPGAAVFLQHESRVLCGRINAYLGRPAVARLRFVPAPLSPRLPARPPSRLTPEIAPGDPALTFAGPDNLRDALIRLARFRRNVAEARD
jgi:hypothetical protein